VPISEIHLKMQGTNVTVNERRTQVSSHWLHETTLPVSIITSTTTY